jgi:hypothetical protein
MSNHPDIAGREFDWFAVDRAGCVALLATAGAGQVPAIVLANYQEYDGMSESLPSPTHWGSEQIWDDYAAIGLYVYDWSHEGTYRRQRSPSKEMDEALRIRLSSLSSLPRLDIEFKDHETVAPGLI